MYGYFDVKKNKLKWTGSREDLKAFDLTLIDEETGEATTWRSLSGGKWIFESKPLVVTWQDEKRKYILRGREECRLRRADKNLYGAK